MFVFFSAEPASTQGLAGVTVDKPIARGECGVGVRGEDRFMICRGNDGRLVNEGLIKDAPATGAPAANAPTLRQAPAPSRPQAPAVQSAPAVARPQEPPSQPQPQTRRVETVVEATIDDLPIDDTVQKIGAMQINGCAVFSKWRDGFSVDAWNRRDPVASIFSGSEFRIPAFLSDGKTRELFDVPYSEWTPNQRQAVENRATSCNQEAYTVRQKLDNEYHRALNEVRNGRASASIATRAMALLRIGQSHVESTDVFRSGLASWNRTFDNRKEMLAQIEMAFDELSKTPLTPNLLGNLIPVTEPRSLGNLNGFRNLRLFSPEETKAMFDRFIAWRDDAIGKALQPVVAAVSAAPATLSGLAAVRAAADASPIYVTLQRIAPENAGFAKVAGDIKVLSDKVQEDATKAFNATVAAAPLTMAGAIAIEKSAVEIRQARLPVSPADWSAAEDKHATAIRAALSQVATEVRSFDANSYRDVPKLKARLDAVFAGSPGRAPMTVFGSGKFERDFADAEKAINEKLTSLATRLLPEFTKDVTALPNTEDGRRRLEAMGKPVTEFFGPVGGSFGKVIQAKNEAIGAAVKAETCRTTIKAAGISASDGARLVPTLKGTVPMSQFICGLIDEGSSVTEFKAPNMFTGLFASEISFKFTARNQLPLRIIGKEADVSGQKIVYMDRIVEDVSNKTTNLSSDEWREFVTRAATPEDAPGAAEMRRLNSELNRLHQMFR
jgi:hypothetical protein